MYEKVDVVRVFVWGFEVGAVAFDPGARAYVFEFKRNWKARAIDLAPLHMATRQGRFVFPLLPRETYQGLPAMLADALPDRFGNSVIDAALAREGVSPTEITALDRLAYVGNRSMGALEFKPSRGSIRRKPTAIVMSELVQGARAALTGQFADDPTTKAAIENLIQVGISAGGARAKAVITYNDTTNEIRSGQLPAEPGFEHWLLKFDGVGKDLVLGTAKDYGRIEYAYHLMALEAGINMTECRLLEESGRAHFMTRRYDREGAKKHHAQSLCAMSHLDFNQRGTHDYSQLFLTCQQLGLDELAMEEVFRRMVFNVAAANCDDHTKNFSFLLKESGDWQITPAYDVTHAYDPKGEWTYQHLMSVNGKFKDIERSDVMTAADRFKISNAKRIVDGVNAALEKWSEYADKAQIGDVERKRVGDDIKLL